MSTSLGHRLAGVALLVTLVAAVAPAFAQAQAGPAYVTRAIDGDTIYAELGGRLETIRYLGVNTPRIEHPIYGPEAYARLAREANRRLVEGKWVRLVFDGPTRDRYGRLIAYVWVGRLFVNALMVHRGYAEATAASTAEYADYFRTLEEGARRDARGLWRDPAVQAFRRPHTAEGAGDEYEFRSADSSGGRVFSAPAPFIPSTTGAPAPAPSLGVPSGPAPAPAPSTGSPSYVAPRGSMRR
jgi:micrococcal nuclease